jgi:hypothetical protein
LSYHALSTASCPACSLISFHDRIAISQFKKESPSLPLVPAEEHNRCQRATWDSSVKHSAILQVSTAREVGCRQSTRACAMQASVDISTRLRLWCSGGGIATTTRTSLPTMACIGYPHSSPALAPLAVAAAISLSALLLADLASYHRCYMCHAAAAC